MTTLSIRIDPIVDEIIDKELLNRQSDDPDNWSQRDSRLDGILKEMEIGRA